MLCYFHYLKSILNDDSFEEYINPVVFINLKYGVIQLLRLHLGGREGVHQNMNVCKRVKGSSYSYQWKRLHEILLIEHIVHELHIIITLICQKLKAYWLNLLKRKNQWRWTNHPLLWNKHEYQHSASICVKNIFSLFHGTGFFIYASWKTSENRGFVMFLGVIERDQCHEFD